MVESFSNVRLTAKANIYFDGRITSRTFFTDDGSRKTLGIVLPGSYELAIGPEERVEVLSGALEVTTAMDSGQWKNVGPGESFTIPANSAFTMRTYVVSDYVCSYATK